MRITGEQYIPKETEKVGHVRIYKHKKTRLETRRHCNDKYSGQLPTEKRGRMMVGAKKAENDPNTGRGLV